MRWLLPLMFLVAGSCSYVFDHSPPDLPLVGSPPPLGSLKKFNRSPADDGGIVAGRDGSYWVFTKEGKSYHLTRLSPPEREEDLTADQFYITWRAFYLLNFGDSSAPAAPMTQLTVRSAGESPGATFEFPQGIPMIVSGGADDVFVYLSTNPVLGYYEIVRRDGSMRRKICLVRDAHYPDCPVRSGAVAGTSGTWLNPSSPGQSGGFFFNNSGTLFFDRYIDGSTVAHMTTEEKDYPTVQIPGNAYYFEPLESFVTCAEDGPAMGIRLFHITDGDPLVLDSFPCIQIIAFSDSEVYYFSPASEGRSMLLAVPFIGGKTRVVFDRPIAQLLSFGRQEDQPLYSLDPSDRYIYGEGDGWLGDWRFMERGRAAGFSHDGKRVRWLEHATTLNGVGDLDSAPIGGAPIRIARNVRQYGELRDGRVLAVADRAFRGVQSRIVAIDEQAGVAQWVVDSANGYQFIPGSSDLLVEIVTGPVGLSDYVRVPLPPKIASVDGGSKNK